MLALAPLFPKVEVIMSLLKLGKMENSEWWAPKHRLSFRKNSYYSRQHSPVQKKLRDCTILNYYTYIYPTLMNGDYSTHILSKISMTLDIVVGLSKYRFEAGYARIKGLC